MPGYCPPTLGKEVLKYRRVHVCMLIQEKYEHQMEIKHRVSQEYTTDTNI